MYFRFIKTRAYIYLRETRRCLRGNNLLFYLLVLGCMYFLWAIYRQIGITLNDAEHANSVMYEHEENDRQGDTSHAENIRYIATMVEIGVNIIPNDDPDEMAQMAVTLFNKGEKPLTYLSWRIFFTHVYKMFQLNDHSGLKLGRVNGGLNYISPNIDRFKGISPRSGITCYLAFRGSCVKSVNMPNWYVVSTADYEQQHIILNTQKDNLTFVTIQETTGMLKNSVTPEQRYRENTKSLKKFEKLSVIPTPQSISKLGLPDLQLKQWVIVKSSTFQNAINLLFKNLNIKLTQEQPISCFKTSENCVKFYDSKELGEEEYALEINGFKRSVTITASTPVGAFYGAQTLISLCNNSDRIPSLLIKDKPRFPFRGLMVDVSRNFHSKETIIQLLEVMAMYKLNKFHFHLTDDEGWRIEIPKLPELTKYGSRRCHSFKRNKCLMPSLGSGPGSETSGSGFYTFQDYRDILIAANAHHIQVIPEIDMPGHAMAALTAMSHRVEESLEKGSDPIFKTPIFFDGSSDQESPNGWQSNVLNPCLNSTYTLVYAILDGLISLHKGIQDLKIVHLGGDEVQTAAWKTSVACASFMTTYNHSHLTNTFLNTVSGIAANRNIDIMFWNDALYGDGREPRNRKEFKNSNVYVNAWYNRPGQDGNILVSDLANADYPVVLSVAKRLYFDHQYEKDPDDIGVSWATGSINTFDVFTSIPYSYHMVCPITNCPEITNPKKIHGISAHIWCEVVRSRSMLHHMLFPRLLAVAERAWHQAPWETIRDQTERISARTKDWESFASLLGHKELQRLEKKGIFYRVPPPGAIVNDNNTVSVNSVYPNHSVYVKLNENTGWEQVLNGNKHIGTSTSILLKSVSPVLNRSSKEIRMNVT